MATGYDPSLGRLSKLPAELRLSIYGYLFSDGPPIVFDICYDDSAFVASDVCLAFSELPQDLWSGVRTMAALSRTSQQLGHEARAYFFSMAMFVLRLTDKQDLKSLSKACFKATLSSMRNITIRDAPHPSRVSARPYIQELMTVNERDIYEAIKSSRRTIDTLFPTITAKINLKITKKGEECALAVMVRRRGASANEDRQEATKLQKEISEGLGNEDLRDGMQMGMLEDVLRAMGLTSIAKYRQKVTAEAWR
ncbi:hypothetical protein LTR85_009030 [Meristemomyces frigidus]|nr:hypothetical protein LTR85_009030 [Meristemomyces frigidus]